MAAEHPETHRHHGLRRQPGLQPRRGLPRHRDQDPVGGIRDGGGQRRDPMQPGQYHPVQHPDRHRRGGKAGGGARGAPRRRPDGPGGGRRPAAGQDRGPDVHGRLRHGRPADPEGPPVHPQERPEEDFRQRRDGGGRPVAATSGAAVQERHRKDALRVHHRPETQVLRRTAPGHGRASDQHRPVHGRERYQEHLPAVKQLYGCTPVEWREKQRKNKL